VDEQREWGVRDLAKHLDLPVSTLHRLLYQLQDEGIIKYNEQLNKYGIGIELIRISAIVSNETDIKKITKPFLQKLVSKYNETFCLVLYDKKRRRIIWADKINGPQPLQYVINIGELQPVPYGSSGKSIMAFLDESDIQKICEEEHFSADQVQELLKQLEQIRKNGVASTRNERLAGSKGIASPILDYEGRPLGSLVFTVPISRFNPELEDEISADIKKAAMEISRILGAKCMI
jgi:DNA-binding IclR family transcriptional regulator